MTRPPTTGRSLLDVLGALLADTAMLPPTSAGPGDAVPQHERYRASEAQALVHSLVVPDVRLGDLATRPPRAALPVTVLVTGGAGAIESAVRWTSRVEGITLVAVRTTLRDEDDLARNAGRTVAMVDHLRSLGVLADDVTVHVEAPRLSLVPEHGLLAALDELAMADLQLTLRTGDGDDGVSPGELTTMIDAALDRELRIAFAGGLTGALTAQGRYGVLNLLAATAAALAGGNVPGALTATSPADMEDYATGRRWISQVHTAAVLEIHDDLIELGLLDVSASEDRT